MFHALLTRSSNSPGNAYMTKYKMTISRLTVDKLGVKLYDKVSAVIAELVANSYDADATQVSIAAPMNELLSTKSAGVLTDKGYTIQIEDNGVGMTPAEVNDFYLKVGAERRNDPKRGDTSGIHNRKVMGRKGVGKLAPFGVCQRIEVISSGGKKIKGIDESGTTTTGYLTAHLILDRHAILKDTGDDYTPKTGKLDGTVRNSHGTVLKLTHFDYRRVPSIDEFERQLAQRFGIRTSNWGIKLVDCLKTNGDPEFSREVGEFAVDQLASTIVRLEPKLVNGKLQPSIGRCDGKEIKEITAGFHFEGKFYPISGWAGYSTAPYRDDLMAGIRIYCRGKIAAQTRIFNLKAGFTGEYDIRSYLVGEIHADWLDEQEDLIRTDRQDILWSHELAATFESWGQALVKSIGTLTREPKRKKAWQKFEKQSDIHARVAKEFPHESQREIRENTLEVARVISQTAEESELADPKAVQSLCELSILIGPHITLDRKLREAADSQEDPLSVITSILKTARVAELAAFGKIADDRIKIIKKIEKLKNDPKTLESAFQSLISEAPWLVNPQWSPLSSNVSFTTLKNEFQAFYKHKTGESLVLDVFSEGNKRADFVFSSMDQAIQIIEIKRPSYSLTNAEMDRIMKYIDLMNEFLKKPGNDAFRQLFPNFVVTLVCDELSLTGAQKTAFDSLKKDRTLEHINWATFLLRTRKMHEEFLVAAEKQKKHASKN